MFLLNAWRMNCGKNILREGNFNLYFVSSFRWNPKWALAVEPGADKNTRKGFQQWGYEREEIVGI
jgi:hypothetical protein